jgi:hypothetical protein
MLQIGKLKTVARVASLILLLVTLMGPWFIDTHPAIEESCSSPLVWLGNGYCACFVSFMAALRLAVVPGHSLLWLACLPLVLPSLSTLLLLLSEEHQSLLVFHFAAWGVAACYSLLMFVGRWYSHPALILWGAGLGGVVAVAVLAGETLVSKSNILADSPSRIV